MKQLLFAVLAATLLFSTSCSKQDYAQPQQPTQQPVTPKDPEPVTRTARFNITYWQISQDSTAYIAYVQAPLITKEAAANPKDNVALSQLFVGDVLVVLPNSNGGHTTKYGVGEGKLTIWITKDSGGQPQYPGPATYEVAVTTKK